MMLAWLSASEKMAQLRFVWGAPNFLAMINKNWASDLWKRIMPAFAYMLAPDLDDLMPVLARQEMIMQAMAADAQTIVALKLDVEGDEYWMLERLAAFQAAYLQALTAQKKLLDSAKATQQQPEWNSPTPRERR